MDLEKERTYKLLQLSTRVCRHCAHFRTAGCLQVTDDKLKTLKSFAWSRLSACEGWTANEVADEALQILTMRKLQGKEIEPPSRNTDDPGPM